MDILFNYQTSELERIDRSQNGADQFAERTTYEPGIGLVFGFNYLMKEHLLLGIELLPTFSYITGSVTETFSGITTESDLSGYRYGLSNTSAALSLAYRF